MNFLLIFWNVSHFIISQINWLHQTNGFLTSRERMLIAQDLARGCWSFKILREDVNHARSCKILSGLTSPSKINILNRLGLYLFRREESWDIRLSMLTLQSLLFWWSGRQIWNSRTLWDPIRSDLYPLLYPVYHHHSTTGTIHPFCLKTRQRVNIFLKFLRSLNGIGQSIKLKTIST